MDYKLKNIKTLSRFWNKGTNIFMMPSCEEYRLTEWYMNIQASGNLMSTILKNNNKSIL